MQKTNFIIFACALIVGFACSKAEELPGDDATSATLNEVLGQSPCQKGIEGTDSAIEYSASITKENPLLYQQWSLRNLRQKAFAGRGTDSTVDMKVEQVHAMGIKGRGVKVLVTDNSLHCHPDLNVDPSLSRDFVDGDNFPEVNSNSSSHGTSVAGLIGMIDNNGIGGVGVAPRVILGGNNYVGTNVSLGQQIQAFGAEFSNGFLACPKDGVRIVNHSWGNSFEYNFSSAQTQLFGSINEVVAQKCGVIAIRAAGNHYLNVNGHVNGGSLSCGSIVPDALKVKGSPVVGCSDTAFQTFNASPHTLLVTAMDGNGKLAKYSSYGANVWAVGAGGGQGYSADRMILKLEKGQEYLLSPAELYSPGLITTDVSGCSKGSSRSYVLGNSLSLSSPNDFIYPWKKYGNANAVVAWRVLKEGSFRSTDSLNQTDPIAVPGPQDNPHRENPNCDYTSSFSGTSAATPNVSGVVALLLEANPELNLRDVKHILATTSQKIDENHAGHSYNGLKFELGWQKNAAGFNYNPRYGFGLPNAYEAVKMAQNLKKFPQNKISSKALRSELVSSSGTLNPDQDLIVSDTHFLSFKPNFAKGENLSIESITLFISAKRGTLDRFSEIMFKLVSPSKTEAIVIRPFNFLTADNSRAGNEMNGHPVVINKFYGENPDGEWKLYVYDVESDGKKLSDVSGNMNFLFH